MALFFWSDNLYNNKVDFDLHPGIHELPFKPVTMVIQHTVLLGLYGKLFHSYQFSSLVRFKTTSLNWISLVMKIDIRGIISHTTLVGMLYYYIILVLSLDLLAEFLLNKYRPKYRYRFDIEPILVQIIYWFQYWNKNHQEIISISILNSK